MKTFKKTAVRVDLWRMIFYSGRKIQRKGKQFHDDVFDKNKTKIYIFSVECHNKGNDYLPLVKRRWQAKA